MNRTSRSATAWRWAVTIFAVLAAVQLGIEIFSAPRVLQLGVAGEPLFEGGFLRERGPTTFVVESMPAGSPLAAAGVVPGDRIRFDDPIGRWHNLSAGERVALTVLHGAETRRIDVVVAPAKALPRHQTTNYVMDIVERLAALLLGVLIGWRLPDFTAFRALAAAGLLHAFVFPYSAPASAHLGWLDFVGSVSQDIGLGALTLFATNYPDDRPIGLRATMRRYFPWLFGALIVVAVFHYARLYTGYFELETRWIFRAYAIVLPVLFFWAIYLAWRQSQGDSRIRLQWILATVGTIMVAVVAGTLNTLTGDPIPPEDLGLAQNVAALAAELGLVYAVLRRRIFDFGFAVNRTLVFGIVGAILLGVFQIAHGIVGEFLHFDDKNKAILLSAILAVAVYLAFNQLKKVVEKVVDRIFFNSWTVSEEQLKGFVAQAKHATDGAALTRLLVAALDRFTGGAGCAVFERRDDGAYRRSESTLAGAPDEVGANDETVLAMRACDQALPLRDGAAAAVPAAALALPMAHRGDLPGFVLLGPRHEREPYRPDQIDALERAVHDVGLDFHALRVERLVQQVAAERRAAEMLRAQLQTAMAVPHDGS
jgi:hypothetical protein